MAHTAVSLEGATTGFTPDAGRFYEFAATWHEDITLAGSDTILAQERTLATAPRPGPAAHGPLLAVVDGKGRIREGEALREVGHWSNAIASYALSTPPRPPTPFLPALLVGTERVNLAETLSELGRREHAKVVRVDSGGALTGALLTAGLTYRDLRHWNTPGCGGHFMSQEEPEQVVTELRTFFGPLRR